VALLQLLLTLDNDGQTDVIACWQLRAPAAVTRSRSVTGTKLTRVNE